MMLVRTRPLFPAFDVDRLFDQLTTSLRSASPRTPVIDAAWRDGTLELTVDLPGTPEDALRVEVADRTLTIGVQTDELRWSRSLRLGAALDPQQVSAHYLHGRLTVTVAAAATAQPRTIAITTSAPAGAIEASEATPAAEATQAPQGAIDAGDAGEDPAGTPAA